eukprot:4321799-Karenia_brevis.AAC.1
MQAAILCKFQLSEETPVEEEISCGICKDVECTDSLVAHRAMDEVWRSLIQLLEGLVTAPLWLMSPSRAAQLHMVQDARRFPQPLFALWMKC